LTLSSGSPKDGRPQSHFREEDKQKGGKEWEKATIEHFILPEKELKKKKRKFSGELASPYLRMAGTGKKNRPTRTNTRKTRHCKVMLPVRWENLFPWPASIICWHQKKTETYKRKDQLAEGHERF